MLNSMFGYVPSSSNSTMDSPVLPSPLFKTAQDRRELINRMLEDKIKFDLYGDIIILVHRYVFTTSLTQALRGPPAQSSKVAEVQRTGETELIPGINLCYRFRR